MSERKRTDEQIYRDTVIYLAAELCNVEATRPGMLQPKVAAFVRAILDEDAKEQLELEGKQ